MDKESVILIVCNPDLENQRLYAMHLDRGFTALGYNSFVSKSPSPKNVDVYVCIGPHYALDACMTTGKPIIYIDRCLWGDDLEYVTIGWLNEDGGMRYPINAPGHRSWPQDVQPWRFRDESKAIYLMDYGPYANQYRLALEHYEHVTMRVHPATGKIQPALQDHLKGHGVAIGNRTSALVTAALLGYPVISFDKRSPVYEIAGHDILDIRRPDRTQWLDNMSHAQWSAEEIRSGEALTYVLNHAPITRANYAFRSKAAN